MTVYTVSSIKSPTSYVDGLEDAILTALQDEIQYDPAYGVDVQAPAGQFVFTTADLGDYLDELHERAVHEADWWTAVRCRRAANGDENNILSLSQQLAELVSP